MHLPLTVRLDKQPDGVYVDVVGEGVQDRIGPFNVNDPSQLLQAVLSRPEQEGLGTPSRRMLKRARRTEKGIAEDVGGKQQKNSGALPWAKGDVRKKGELRIESKTTRSKQYTVTRRELDKIRGECGLGEKPAFVITFVNRGTLREEDKWVLIPYEDWRATHKNR